MLLDSERLLRKGIPVNAFPEGFIGSNDYYATSLFWAVTDNWIARSIKEILPSIARLTSKWIEARPTLSSFTSIQYLGAMVLREGFELKMSEMSESKVETALELGDIIFFLSVMARKINSPILETLKPEQIFKPPDDSLKCITNDSDNILFTLALLDRVTSNIKSQISIEQINLIASFIGYSFSLIVRYATINQIDVDQLMIVISDKVERHFPASFFIKDKTPFLNPSDAISCLRLMREEKQLPIDTTKQDIKTFLTEIAKGENATSKIMADELLKSGNWN